MTRDRAHAPRSGPGLDGDVDAGGAGGGVDGDGGGRDRLAEEDAASALALEALDTDVSLTSSAYGALKAAIMAMRIYDREADLRLDERRLAQELGISRTPVREALLRLEHEGLVRTVPRRGVYVVRKTKAEIIEIITVSAALESMAARLATVRASDQEIATLREFFADFGEGSARAHLDEYSHANLRFHQRIVEISHSPLLGRMVGSLQVHMRAIRGRTMGDEDRVARSIVDHFHIIEALEGRDIEGVESLVRDHALSLARHVADHVTYLD
ncbi:MAG TPA: GntR family transcriptional regulator [Acidimicrobiales bacterium]|nr:GntR family transcriptional regulator [Acidimicrobiales bacterium]